MPKDIFSSERQSRDQELLSSLCEHHSRVCDRLRALEDRLLVLEGALAVLLDASRAELPHRADRALWGSHS
jgi:predicted component of type VI protein secretion system